MKKSKTLWALVDRYLKNQEAYYKNNLKIIEQAKEKCGISKTAFLHLVLHKRFRDIKGL